MYGVEWMVLAFRASCIDDGKDNVCHDEDRQCVPLKKGKAKRKKSQKFECADMKFT